MTPLGGGGWRGATRRNGGRHHVTVFGSPVFPGLGTTESVARPSLALSSSWNLNQGITRSTHVCKFLFPSWASITISPSRNIASVLLENSKEHNASSATDLVQMNPVSLSEKKKLSGEIRAMEFIMYEVVDRKNWRRWYPRFYPMLHTFRIRMMNFIKVIFGNVKSQVLRFWGQEIECAEISVIPEL